MESPVRAVVGGGQISEEDETDCHSVSLHRRGVHGRRQRVLELQPERLDRYHCSWEMVNVLILKSGLKRSVMYMKTFLTGYFKKIYMMLLQT